MDNQIANEICSISRDIFHPKIPYCLFLGAGASLPSAPTTSSLVNGLLEEIYPMLSKEDREKNLIAELAEFALPAKVRLEPICELFKSKRGERALERYLKTKFDQLEVSEGYRSLAKIVKKGYISTIFTTNIDKLLEAAFLQDNIFKEDEFEVFVSNEDYSTQIPQSMPRIYHLHGTYANVNPGVLWNELKELPQEKFRHLQHYWENFNFIFVGYSAEDMDIFDALKRTEISKRRGTGTYWFKKSRQGDKVMEIMSKYSTLKNLFALEDSPTGSEIFPIMEYELLGLARILGDKRSADLEKAREKISIMEKNLNELKYLVESLDKP